MPFLVPQRNCLTLKWFMLVGSFWSQKSYVRIHDDLGWCFCAARIVGVDLPTISAQDLFQVDSSIGCGCLQEGPPAWDVQWQQQLSSRPQEKCLGPINLIWAYFRVLCFYHARYSKASTGVKSINSEVQETCVLTPSSHQIILNTWTNYLVFPNSSIKWYYCEE